MNDLKTINNTFKSTDKLPVLFLGHGSPMNAIEENQFVRSFRELGEQISKPSAILCISAHWETKGTLVTSMDMPRTIHDFGGFPQELFEIQYPAPGNPALAEKVKHLVQNTEIGLDMNWGLDHGAWSVLRHIFPNADVPIVQLSLDFMKSAKYHFNLAQELLSLRRKGVLIIGSGNMVHNLQKVAWRKLAGDPYAFDWAVEANEKMKKYIQNQDVKSLIDYENQGNAFDLAIPTPEHYLPLLYVLALKEKEDHLSFFNDQIVGGSISMTSIMIK